MPKFYCGLCETSHHELKEGATCLKCGKKYCIDSIQFTIDVVKEECPYCDTPLKWTPEVSSFMKRRISEKTPYSKHSEVQTAPSVSREAVLNYLQNMFSRMKGGMTLLLPHVNDIPVDIILETKNHQRINLVSVLDPTTHSDLLKRLFSKPNVRVRRVDTSKFEGVENYIAADRDGEEVFFALTDGQGETVAIASYSDAFVTLMGKVVLGDYFLARSVEINRAEVGM